MELSEFQQVCKIQGQYKYSLHSLYKQQTTAKENKKKNEHLQ